MADQLDLTALGSVEFEWEDDEGRGHKVKWRRPPLGVFRDLRNLLRELADKTTEKRVRLRFLLTLMDHRQAGADLPEDFVFPEDWDWDEFDEETAWDEIQDLRDEISDYTVEWVQEADRRLAQAKHLPESVDDWPAWAATSSLPSQIITFWSTVPLAPGASGTNGRESGPTRTPRNRS